MVALQILFSRRGQAAVRGGTAPPLAGKAGLECGEYFLPVRTERVRAGAGRASGTLGLSALF